MKEIRNINILAIESSCDETAAAVVHNGRKVLSNIISSQIDLHKLYGGVVPEIASRKHIEKINQVIEEALKEAEVTLKDIDAVAVTYGPGLVGALLVGVAEAKAIAYAAGLPLVGVHHIEGHISANYIEHPELEPPFLCLVASGGHTHLVCVKDYGKYEILGRTRDDAAGEAYDKVAKSMQAAEDYSMRKFAIAGGVASNTALRTAMEAACAKRGIQFYHPSPIYCTDNAAMIGAAGFYEYLAGTRHGWDLNAVPNLKLGER